MDFSAVAVQALGVATSICLCFMGYVGRRGVQWISVATCVLGGCAGGVTRPSGGFGDVCCELALLYSEPV